MAASNTSSLAKLFRIQKQMQKLGSPEFLAYVSKKMEKPVLRLIDQGFRNERDPYDQPWAPLMPSTLKSKNGSKILQNTGKLRAGFKITAQADGVRVKNSTPYAGYHQSGTKKMPQRAMLPVNNVMPLKWKEKLVPVFERALLGWFEGRKK